MTDRVRNESALRFIQGANPLLGVFARALGRNQRGDEDLIRAYAERRLRRLVRIAARRSPHYRETFKRLAIDPREIQQLEDLEILPTIGRSDLVEHPERFLTVPGTFVRAAHTSGTSGEPATCFRTAGSIVFELAALERQLGWHGIDRSPRSLVVREESPTLLTR